jgi:gamma-glutamyltranspeptidase / glutathione hydrolase
MSGVVSSGNHQTTQAAVRMLELGGNAFDAILSAGFVSAAVELGFSSLGGGGFLLGYRADEKVDFLYDFFVNHPGLNATSLFRPVPEETLVNYSGTHQKFHVGIGSLGVHGTIKGFQKCYEELCTLDIATIVAPAIEVLTRGTELTPSLEFFLHSLQPITGRTKYGEKYFHAHNTLHFNPLLKDFLEMRSFEAWIDILYEGAGTEKFLSEVEEAVTQDDLTSYEVIERTPLYFPYKDYMIVTNSEPSIGGSTVCKGLQDSLSEDSAQMSSIDRSLYRAEILKNLQPVHATSGTTHMNVIDAAGNAASMSLSIGTCSGYFYPNTGILMNNMMGEEDLHQPHVQSRTPGSRICSMMAPTFVKKDNKLLLSLGTGGSNRIRTALLQFLWNYLDEGMNLKDAVESPRIHYSEKGSLEIEPFNSKELERILTLKYPKHRLWDIKHLYFGGVHVVSGDYDGWGDTRRDGSYHQLYTDHE